MKKGPVIAIDGPGGVGKSSVSRLIAEKLRLRYIDTGAMYRAVAVGAYEAGVDTLSDKELERYLKTVDIRMEPEGGRIFLNNEDFSAKIRQNHVGDLASRVSKKGPVRRFLAGLQRRLADTGNVVMEGRDIGTVVLPDADLKIFLDADQTVRAERRHREFTGSVGEKDLPLDEVKRGLKERDRRDTGRDNSPLRKADDAVYIDTTEMGIEQVVEKIVQLIKERVGLRDTCR